MVLPERNPENKRKRMNEVLKPFELDKCPASRLPEEVQSFMKAIVSVCSYGNIRVTSGEKGGKSREKNVRLWFWFYF